MPGGGVAATSNTDAAACAIITRQAASATGRQCTHTHVLILFYEISIVAACLSRTITEPALGSSSYLAPLRVASTTAPQQAEPLLICTPAVD
ncbi:unnamed protein product [Ceratitis capitata]|uniref:(Mediterranean fruit fly) hypothetical protein n=1 Tax=Ceratitis capitata TaxID=7213 RepID=A0A811UHG6_CERCA|nr:unnamed protein product [Ceratitis capitata]